jgi:hypothetical protein
MRLVTGAWISRIFFAKAHPDVRHQADVGFASRWHHGVLAALQLLKGGTRSQVLCEYLVLMRQLSRQLDDARSLTLSADLSDTVGRAQTEINALILGLAREAGGVPGSRYQLTGQARSVTFDSARWLVHQPVQCALTTRHMPPGSG